MAERLELAERVGVLDAPVLTTGAPHAAPLDPERLPDAGQR